MCDEKFKKICRTLHTWKCDVIMFCVCECIFFIHAIHNLEDEKNNLRLQHKNGFQH